MPQIALTFGVLFASTLAFLYLRYPVRMWEKALRPAFGGVVISDSTGKRISYFMGAAAMVFGLILSVFLVLSFIHVARA